MREFLGVDGFGAGILVWISMAVTSRVALLGICEWLGALSFRSVHFWRVRLFADCEYKCVAAYRGLLVDDDAIA